MTYSIKTEEIKNTILAKTNLSNEKALQKALRIRLGQITLESVIGEESEEKVQTTEEKQQKVYIPYGFFNLLGMEEKTVVRKVTNIKADDFGEKEGQVKIAGKTLNVYFGSDEWILV